MISNQERKVVPEPGAIDGSYGNSDYTDFLSPGVLLATPEVGACLTTSGVALEGPLGEQGFTVAIHGFENSTIVVHPEDGPSRIGEVVMGFQKSDIGIAILDAGLRYFNNYFEVDMCGNFDLVPPFQINNGDVVSIDTFCYWRTEAGLPRRTFWSEK